MPLDKKSITYVIWRADLGGVEKSLLNYIEHLQLQYKISIFSLKKPTKSIFSGKNIEVNYGGRIHFFVYLNFLIYCIQNRQNIFHLLNTGPIIILICRIVRIKRFIYHIRGTRYFKKKNTKFLFQFLWNVSIPPHTILLANSEYSKMRFLEQITSKFKIQTIYNPFDLKKFNSSNRLVDKNFTVLYAGRLVEGKNLHKWLQIAAALKSEFPKIKFRIVGRGVLKSEIKEYILQNTMQHYVKVEDYVESIEKVYQSCSLLLFLSEYESFGNVVVESILCGTPVIAGKIPSMMEIFKQNDLFLVDLRSNDLANEILKRIKDYRNLLTETNNIRNVFIKSFALDKHLESLTQIYEEIN